MKWKKSCLLHLMLPSASDVAKADDIELQEIAKSTEDLTIQFNGLPMCELLGWINNSGVIGVH